MQFGNLQVSLFIIITTSLISLLAVLTISLIYIYHNKGQAYQTNIEKMKFEFEKNLLATRAEIQEQTLLHISREIHDNINLSLTLAKLNLNTLDWNDVNKAFNCVNDSIDIIGSAITDLSDMSKSMNPELIGNLGLINALEKEIMRIQKLARIRINLELSGYPVFIESEKELVVFRIIQEAFNNIIKHSQAKNVTLKLHYDSRHIEIWIKDDGVGFTQNPTSMLKESKAGLLNMQTRAELFNGSIKIESTLQDGTQLLIKIPL
jgi:two-component system NarL family sensor kinase